jgi:NADPH:quinone reductase-like Zn-dependent oxidoreductase
VLVWGIGGGVATAAFRIAQALGARTIVTSSSDEKLARARELGADVDRQPRDGDVVAAVKEATGRAPTSSSRRSARRRGSARSTRRARRRVVVCGATSGPNPPAALHRSGGSSSTARLDDGHARRLRGRLRPRRAGAKPVIDRSSRSPRPRAAHERLESGEQFGKILSMGLTRRGLTPDRDSGKPCGA